VRKRIIYIFYFQVFQNFRSNIVWEGSWWVGEVCEWAESSRRSRKIS